MSNKKKLDYSRKYECPNVDCGVETYLEIKRPPGLKELFIFVFLLLLYIVPGIVYIIYINKKYNLKKYTCPKCNFDISVDYIKHRDKENINNKLLKIALIVLIILGVVGIIYLTDKNKREEQLIRTINRSIY